MSTSTLYGFIPYSWFISCFKLNCYLIIRFNDLKLEHYMSVTRFDMRLDNTIKLKAEKAVALLGLKSLTEYVSKLMDDDASRVISQHETITVEDDVFDRFIKACDSTSSPNQALKGALELTKKSGIK